MTSVLDRAADQLEEQANPAYLTAIQDWRDSDCSNPDREPSRSIAPNWLGSGGPCREHGGGCQLCHSCAACRPEQRAPFHHDAWDVWLYLAGRGAGKTRSAAEVVAELLATRYRWRIAILAPTYADARDTCVEGESGLISVFDRFGWVEGEDYVWNRSLGEIRVRHTKSRVKLYSAEKPARLRGPQHHFAWVDELAQVAKLAADAWRMLQFGMRLGKHPRIIGTTTPLPVQLVKDLINNPRCVVTRGRTDDNATNLAEPALRALHEQYDGTRLGRQELDAELLDDLPGALWQRAWLDANRIRIHPTARWSEHDAERTAPAARAILAELRQRGITLVRVVIAVDPAVTSGEDADESGIIAIGRAVTGRYYVLADYTIRDTPHQVCRKIIQAYDDWSANLVITEVNNGGEWIPGLLSTTCQLVGHDPIATKAINAKKGKRVRAEPVSAIYEQHRVHHVGTHSAYEDQLCTWLPESVQSPDRMDAGVYGVLYLEGGGLGSSMMSASSVPNAPQIPRHQQTRTGWGGR